MNKANDTKNNSEELINDEFKPKEETYYIKGLGSVTSVGEYDMEKFIRRLLKSKYITG